MIDRIRRRLKWIWHDVMRSAYPDFSELGGHVRVLCFHGVCPDGVPFINGRFMHLSQFRELLMTLKQQTHILSAEDFHAGILSPDRLNILLTFDDGYRNNKELVLPVLEELAIPSVWFATGRSTFLYTDLLDIAADSGKLPGALYELAGVRPGKAKELKKRIVHADASTVRAASEMLASATEGLDEKYRVFRELLGDEELKELSTHPLVYVGNHSFNHFNLTCIPAEEVSSEILRCEERLSKSELNTYRWMAIPFGAYSSSTLEILENYKYCRIFVNGRSEDSGEYITERLTVNPFISLKNQLLAIYHGYY